MAEEQTNTTPDEEVPESKVLEIPLEEAASKTPPETRPAPKARGKRGPDKKPRAKPKPKARRSTCIAPLALERAPQNILEESSEESADEATLQELHSLNLIRSIRAYDSQRHVRKQQLYASWFGR